MSFTSITLSDNFREWREKINLLGEASDLNDSQNVKLSGSQTIGGTKTFQTQIVASNGIASTGAITSAGSLTITSGNVSVTAGSLTVGGAITGTSLSVSGSANFTSSIPPTSSGTTFSATSLITRQYAESVFASTAFTNSTYVALTGNQTVSGNKTFTGTTALAGTTAASLNVSGTSTLNAVNTVTLSVSTNASFVGSAAFAGPASFVQAPSTSAVTFANDQLVTKQYVDSQQKSEYDKVKKFAESTSGLRHYWDALAFVDSDDNARVIGNSQSSRFGTQNVFDPAITLSIPHNLNCSSLYVNRRSCFVLSNSGTVYASGLNDVGQLGIIGAASYSYPTLIGVNNVAAIVNSDEDAYSHGALTTSGQLYLFGSSQYGQIGNGSTTSTAGTGPYLSIGPGSTSVTTPVQKAIAIGGASSGNRFETYCVLLNNGTLRTVGYGNRGQMGNGASNTVNSTWQQVLTGIASPLTNVVNIYACGENANTCFYALTASGLLYGWGYNGNGNLGQGDTTNRSFAVLVSSDVEDVWPMSSDGSSVFFKKTDGNFYAAGRNNYGQLGIGNVTSNISAVTLITSLSGRNIDRIYPGGGDFSGVHAFAKVAGTNEIYATGYNAQGQLGLGDTTLRNQFTLVNFNTSSPIVDIYGGVTSGAGGFTVILTAAGETYFTGVSRWGMGSSTNSNKLMFARNTGLIC